jgi:Transposase DDE domain
MSTDAKQGRLRPHARGFLDSLREFLTPAIWKHAEQARACRRRSPRWATQPLVLTLLVMTWCCGDSQAERFETAKGFTAVCLFKRRRPGQTVQGFQKALAKVPLSVLRAVAAGVRCRLLRLFDLVTDGFVVFGCDGSTLECPRVEELERRLDRPAKNRQAPQVWVTALVHLRTGLLWAWWLGKGYSRERSHLRALLRTLPAAALVVADAGYNGYDLAQALLTAGVSFLVRMSSKDTLYTLAQVELTNCTDTEVLLWTQGASQHHLPPLRLRLICIRGRQPRKDVWLLTNVLDAKKLSVERAGQYYRWRWENEGLFRTYKRTLAKVKLMSRTIRLVHREAEGALLATQLLLAQGTRALASGKPEVNDKRCSPRKVLLEIRQVIMGGIGSRQRARFGQRLAKALREQRQRTTPKVKRVWPRRVDHKPPKPPHLRMLTDEQKALIAKLLGVAA